MSGMRAGDWAELPYPGVAPDFSYVVTDDGSVHRVTPGPGRPTGWQVEGVDLDAWLRTVEQPTLTERTPILSYASNQCPAKVLRQGGPFVNLRCEVEGFAAVWADGTRGDGQVVATLAALPDVVSSFFVSMCTADEIAVLDEVEGRGSRYDLVELPAGAVSLENGTRPSPVSAYVGCHPSRSPVVDQQGAPIPVDALDQQGIGELLSRRGSTRPN